MGSGSWVYQQNVQTIYFYNSEMLTAPEEALALSAAACEPS